MTGRYNIRYGFASGVLKPMKPYGLPLNETIVPQYLNALGFESHMVGKVRAAALLLRSTLQQHTSLLSRHADQFVCGVRSGTLDTTSGPTHRRTEVSARSTATTAAARTVRPPSAVALCCLLLSEKTPSWPRSWANFRLL
jgi:arylsulfatase A-like enzyme